MKVALITGAGSGIGQATAFALAQADFAVVLAGRRTDRLEATAATIAAEGGTALAVGADVTDEASVDQLFGQLVGRFGRLDVLFNNAGISPSPATIDTIDVDAWRRVVDVNLTGAFLCTRAAVRLMKRQSPGGGRIINNGSVAAHVPRPYLAAYTASKHAITGLTRATALEGRPFDIACGQIDVGNAGTAIGREVAGQGAGAAPGNSAEPTFDVRHVAEAVRYMAGLPLDANVLNMTVMATGMPYVGRG